MSSLEHNRYKVVSTAQHLLEHDLSEFPYAHNALPDTVLNLSDTLDYILNSLYPNVKASVATPADLPTGVDTPNIGDVAPTLYDQRIVDDDGDGKAAIYMFVKYDGEAAPLWHKVADIDWGMGTVISELTNNTLYLYTKKYGNTDYDLLTELPLIGINAGQHLYGGDLANQNLSLHANNGDAPATHTGYVQVDDSFRPMLDLTYDLGTITERWDTAYIGTLVIGTATMTITSDGVNGSITDTTGLIDFDNENLTTSGEMFANTLKAVASLTIDNTVNQTVLTVGQLTSTTGAISFDNENLSTTGTLSSGQLTVLADLILAVGSITSASGAISFGNENLSTTGTLGAGVSTFTQLNVDDLRLDGNTLSIQTLNTNLNLASNGTGIINLSNAAQTLGITATGTVGITGLLTIDSLSFDGDLISSGTNEIRFDDHIRPSTDNSLDIGDSTHRVKDLFIAQNISNGTNLISMTEVLSARNLLFRDAARTQAVQAGDSLFWDAVSSTWLASAPDSEITHNTLSGLTTGDAGHTQFALLAGRAGGQTLNGGTVITNKLNLYSYSGVANGLIVDDAALLPQVTALYDLGSASKEFLNLYMDGQAFGLRTQNDTAANIATLFNGSEQGRLFFGTDTKFLYVNDGSSNKKVGHNTYNQVKTETELGSAITVSAYVSDARNCIWQLTDASNNYEIMGVAIQKTSTTVTIVNDVALPAGNYRLLGIEV